MKAILVFAIIATLTKLALSHSGKVSEEMQQCLTENNLTEADLKTMFSSLVQADAKDSTKCFSKCLMEKRGHFQDGVFNAQAMIDDLKKIPQLKKNQDEIIAGVESCKDIKGSNDCDTAFQITLCIQNNKQFPTRL